MRPKPRMPSVFSYSSTPENFERSQLPGVSDACACGMLRASASSSAIVCSAAVTTFDCGRVGDDDPAPGGGGARRRCRRPRPRGRSRAGARPARSARRSASSPSGSGSPSNSPMRSASCSSLQSKPSLDVEVLAQQLHARVADLLVDEHLRRRLWRVLVAVRSRAHRRSSPRPVDARGQRAHVVRLDRREHRDPQLVAPELAVRLDVDDPVRAQRRGERRGVDARRRSRSSRRPASACAGSATNGRRVARRARPTRTGASEDSRVRATHQSRPPPSSIQSICSASRNSVAIAGVLYGLVLARALERRRRARGTPGIRSARRTPATRRAARSSAAGLSSASHSPPSDGEALLRREVVRVGLVDLDGQPAGARGARRSATSASPASGGPPHRDHHARSRSRCEPRRSRRVGLGGGRTRLQRSGRVARARRADHDRVVRGTAPGA